MKVRGFNLTDSWAALQGKWRDPQGRVYIACEMNGFGAWQYPKGAIVGLGNAFPIENIPDGAALYTYDNPGTIVTAAPTGAYSTASLACSKCGAKPYENHHKDCKRHPDNPSFSFTEQPSTSYRCLVCSNSKLDQRDMEINNATGNIWGCFKCGSKKLEAV